MENHHVSWENPQQNMVKTHSFAGKITVQPLRHRIPETDRFSRPHHVASTATRCYGMGHCNPLEAWKHNK